jgi:transposase InsO family protein
MTDLCREYGVSRKTGHKLWSRYKELGLSGLEDQSRSPRRSPHRTSGEMVEAILAMRKKYPTWGPKKLKAMLEGELGLTLPVASTIGTVLRKHGLVTQQGQRRRHIARPTKLQQVDAANQVWCADYKGQFRLGDGSYCYPLTITDQFSRYLLACEGMGAISEGQAREVFQDVLREHGLPSAIRTDNGTPFATTGLAGLSRLNVFWMLLGIKHERGRPAHPEDNGRHERMHRTLKLETTRPARPNLLQQQEHFDAFREVFNTKRPHEALEMRRPAELYAASLRPYPAALPEPSYPMHDDTLYVSPRGFLRVPGRGSVYLSAALAGQPVGIREDNDGRWLVSFLDLALGHVEKNRVLTPIQPASPGNPNL